MVGICLGLLAFSSCDRKSFHISSIELYPAAIASHNSTLRLSTLSEGLVLLLSDGTFENDLPYEMSLVSPSKTYSWEFRAQAVPVGSTLALIKQDLLMPADIPLETGEYNVYIWLPDGREFTYPLSFVRSDVQMKNLLNTVSRYSAVHWIQRQQEIALQLPISDYQWSVQLLDSVGTVVLQLDEQSEVAVDKKFQDANFRQSITGVNLLSFNQSKGELTLVKTISLECDPLN